MSDAHVIYTLTIPSTVNTAIQNCKYTVDISQSFVDRVTLRAAEYLAKLAGGATITEGRGLWIDNGKTVVERVRRIELIVLSAADEKIVSAAVIRVARDIGAMFRQDCILVTEQRITASFI